MKIVIMNKDILPGVKGRGPRIGVKGQQDR
jgi:hypothetical protein